MARRLEPGVYWLDDLEVGDWYETPGITVTEAHIVNFAGVIGDFFPLHMDDQFAHELGFKARVAHGLLGLSMGDALKNRSEVITRNIASIGWNWQFKAPIYAGDRIHVKATMRDIRLSRSKPDRGVLTVWCEVVNQDGAVVQEGEHILMTRRKPAGA
jgi:3-hydroxybutyryl-CoA dehydratase